MVLVDLPGQSDTTASRAQAAKQYASACQTLVIASPLARILDAPNISNLIYTPSVKAGSRTSKSDDSKSGTTNTVLTRAEQDQAQKLASEYLQLQDEADELKADVEDAKADSDSVLQVKFLMEWEIKKDAAEKSNRAMKEN
jgi:hypothetical protein